MSFVRFSYILFSYHFSRIKRLDPVQFGDICIRHSADQVLKVDRRCKITYVTYSGRNTLLSILSENIVQKNKKRTDLRTSFFFKVG